MDRGHLRVMATDGSGDHEVDGAAGNPWWPAWSPDGMLIAYETDGVIFIVPAAGGQAVRLAVEQLRVGGSRAWAPGKDLLFSSDGTCTRPRRTVRTFVGSRRRRPRS